ncbi:hypothetical protein S40285_10730 [Stachybotrys chlorohalonatus IBT 40285]|uniref:Uncharacterized protein n=1 Tax=Stachybotrys chlorohalonatus (strain IBT 40285) TaxID=1283841 RepID=A0A084Q936_STAC4|nr:hypothetical protein S40285_10730 [Stachybotrys chlorohalonata IBT 40285]
MIHEEAAAVACVFMTSIYSLHRPARIKRGDCVFFCPATGVVSISAVYLSQFVGAEVNVTDLNNQTAQIRCGTQEKRGFLKSTLAFPEERIFSSRSTEVGDHIAKLTNGKAANIINSLTGKSLDGSWRIIAPGGFMVEIADMSATLRFFKVENTLAG